MKYSITDFKQEFNEKGHHKLINTVTGKATGYTLYTGTTYLDGFVGFSGYYMDKEGILSADEFCKRISVGA